MPHHGPFMEGYTHLNSSADTGRTAFHCRNDASPVSCCCRSRGGEAGLHSNRTRDSGGSMAAILGIRPHSTTINMPESGLTGFARLWQFAGVHVHDCPRLLRRRAKHGRITTGPRRSRLRFPSLLTRSVVVIPDVVHHPARERTTDDSVFNVISSSRAAT